MTRVIIACACYKYHAAKELGLQKSNTLQRCRVECADAPIAPMPCSGSSKSSSAFETMVLFALALINRKPLLKLPNEWFTRYYCNAGHAAFANPGQTAPHKCMYLNPPSHACISRLKSDCSNDIRSFLNFETQLYSKYDVDLPRCPLKPWQIALISLSALHVFAIVLNIAVRRPQNPTSCMRMLSHVVCSGASLSQAADMWPRVVCAGKHILRSQLFLFLNPCNFSYAQHIPVAGWWVTIYAVVKSRQLGGNSQAPADNTGNKFIAV